MVSFLIEVCADSSHLPLSRRDARCILQGKCPKIWRRMELTTVSSLGTCNVSFRSALVGLTNINIDNYFMIRNA